MPSIEVRGLKEAAANLQALGKVASTDLSRKAMLDAALVINRAVKAATYSTFQRRTGFIRSGFGVRVAQGVKGTVLSAFIVQYPQNLSGTSPHKIAQRAAHLPKAKRGKQDIEAIAFYWRFLEFGTKGRRSSRTPKRLKTGHFAHGKAFNRYLASKSLGDIAARPWVRPAFDASARGSIEGFSKSFRARIDTALKNLPKG